MTKANNATYNVEFKENLEEKSYYITNNNFNERYEEIENAIKSATYIAIDAEYSGLGNSTNSLFDDGAERYKKFKESIDGFIIIQFGLTTFHLREKNKLHSNNYEAKMYNFYIIPRQIGYNDKTFCAQSSSLHFLSRCSFDFNKLIYEGISYMNEEQERNLKKEISNDNFLLNCVEMDEEKRLFTITKEITPWCNKAKLNEEHTFEFDDLINNKFLSYLVQKEIRTKFNNIWTYSSSNKIIVKCVLPFEKAEYVVKYQNVLENEIFDYYLGFSKIIKLLVSVKKPIVGHNLLLDFVMIYNQFIEPLPNSYDKFKKKINALFPYIYDTKYLSYELRNTIRKDVPDRMASSALMNIYMYFSDDRWKNMSVVHPVVVLWSEFINEIDLKDIILHEAGWDSLICGFCFIQIAHYFSRLNDGKLNETDRDMTSSEIFSGVNNYVNKIHIVWASIQHINLGGIDPPSNKPKKILVTTKKNSIIDTYELTGLLSHFSSIDMKQRNKKSVLIAVTNIQRLREILTFFKNKHQDRYHAKVYNPIKDSELIQRMCWGGLFLSAGLCIAALLSKRNFSNILQYR